MNDQRDSAHEAAHHESLLEQEYRHSHDIGYPPDHLESAMAAELQNATALVCKELSQRGWPGLAQAVEITLSHNAVKDSAEVSQ